MSDNWIILLPDDPRHVPDAHRQGAAREHFRLIAPEADQIEVSVTDGIQFFDCGANFERILCPSCGSELSPDWWIDRMDEDFERGFKLESYPVPCCGAPHAVHELVYEWLQGFGRFALAAMHPGIGELDDRFKREFEEILGTPLRVIYQHI